MWRYSMACLYIIIKIKSNLNIIGKVYYLFDAIIKNNAAVWDYIYYVRWKINRHKGFIHFVKLDYLKFEDFSVSIKNQNV